MGAANPKNVSVCSDLIISRSVMISPTVSVVAPNCGYEDLK